MYIPSKEDIIPGGIIYPYKVFVNEQQYSRNQFHDQDDDQDSRELDYE